MVCGAAQVLYDLDEQLLQQAHESASRIAKLQQKMVMLNKMIQEVETPRDDSFDNMTVLWCSTVFQQSKQGDLLTQAQETEVFGACGKLEEMGFTVRRCGTYEECVERAGQLQASGHLRCVVAGGEATVSCLPGCSMSHDGTCLVCNRNWRNHSGHRCPDGRTGRWLLKGKNKGTDVKELDCFKLLQTLAEKQGEAEPVPQQRLALFAGISSLKEDKRLALWQVSAAFSLNLSVGGNGCVFVFVCNVSVSTMRVSKRPAVRQLGVTITDDKDQLQEWVEGQVSPSLVLFTPAL